MSKMFKKENIMPIAVLSVICLIVAALLAIVNSIAAPIIKKAEEQKAYDSLRVVIDGDFEEISPIPEGAAESVTAMYKVTDGDTLVGHAVTVAVNGYAGDILMTVGVDAEGKVTKVVVTKQSESHGKAGMAAYPDKFAGVAADDVADVEHFSGATISSTAIRGGVIDAVNVVMGVAAEEPVDYARSDEEVRAFIADMTAGVELEEVSTEGNEYARRAYRDNISGDYFVYTLALSPEYGTPETETIVRIDVSGKILEINKVLWKISDPAPDWGYNPPNEDRINQLYNDFIGKNSDTIGEVDLATGATRTGERLVLSFQEAIETVKTHVAFEILTPEDEIISRAEELLGVEAGSLIAIPIESGDHVKLAFKDAGGENFVFYAYSISSYYGTPDTESLIHIGSDGVIKKVDKMLWKTSAEGWGYVPPTEESVNAFYDRFIGKTSDNVDSVELVTNATDITCPGVMNSVKEALKFAGELIPAPECKEDNTARIVGVAALSLAFVGSLAAVIVSKKKGGKNG